MNTEELSTEEKCKQLGIPVVSNRLSDVPNGTYFWCFGKRWKKVKSGKKTTKVVIEENWDNNLGVLTEQS